MYRISLILLSLSFCNVTFAANETLSNVKITQILSYGGNAIIVFSPSITNTQGCASGATTNSATLRYEGVPGKKEMYATVLSAAMAGKTLNFGVGGCDADYPAIYRVDVKI